MAQEHVDDKFLAPKMNLEALVAQLHRNPSVITHIEAEVNRLAEAPTLAPLWELHSSSNPSVHIFVCKALEFRIKRRIGLFPLGDEIAFVLHALRTSPTQRMCELFSLLGLYCWPAEMPNFLSDVVSLLSCCTGYKILLSFFEFLNTSTDIDDKRRSELKKAIGIVYLDLLNSFNEEYSEFIIRIYTELLKIVPKSFDFSLVFRHAASHPLPAIEFIVEALPYLDSDPILSILPSMPANLNLLKVLSEIKYKESQNLISAFEYSLRSIHEDQECTIPALEFWQRALSSKTPLLQYCSSPDVNPEMVLDAFLNSIVGFYQTGDEFIEEDTEPRIFGVFTLIARNYSERALKFLVENENMLPQRISANFLHKIAKRDEGLPSIQFNSSFLNVLSAFLLNDPSVVSMMDLLDISDKESVRLIVQILQKFVVPSEQLEMLSNKCDRGCLAANEIKAECAIRLSRPIEFPLNSNWGMDKVIQYFYLIKRGATEYLRYKDQFYKVFVENAPFDRCFSIVCMLAEFPVPILESIYQNIDKYTYTDINCFNNDLLPALPIKKPFIEKETLRFVTEWNTVTDYREFYQAVRSLLSVIGTMINEPGMIDILLELLQLDGSMIVGRVMAIFNSYGGQLNTAKAVYYLLCSYSSPNLLDVHASILQGLAICLAQPDGPQAFAEVAGIPIEECVGMQGQMAKQGKKHAVNLTRKFLKNFRGKQYNKLMMNEKKITKQDLFKNGKENESMPFIDLP